MDTPRVYTLRRGDGLCGVLREGRGTFVTATRSSLPAPVLAVAGYTSRDPYSEAAVSAALVAAADFDAALAALRADGFRLEEPAQ